MPFSPKPKSRLATNVSGGDDVDAQPDPTIPYVAYSSNHARISLSSLSSSARNKKKKKLVISGIASTDRKRFDGAKRWCEVRFVVSLMIRF
jgi:hypothetical protein